MYATLKTISILALAGSAVAAPWSNWGGQGKWGNGDGNWDGKDNDNAPAATATEVAVVTATTYVYADSKPTAAPVEQPQANPGNFYGKPSQPAEQPAASPQPSASNDAPVSDGSWEGTVATWRSKMGLSALEPDTTLTANAAKTAREGNGDMVHQLNPGSMAQVLAPGSPDEFEKVFVGGWLCELPNMPGMNGICASMSAGWDYAGQTGHAEILKSGSYSKIGCACEGGIWSCDLA